MTVVNIGTGPNTKTGEPVRLAFKKINDFLGNLAPTIKAEPNVVPIGVLGKISKFITTLNGTVSFVALSGTTNGITVTNNGDINTSIALNMNQEVNVRVRAVNNTLDALERTILLRGGVTVGEPVLDPVFTVLPSITPSSGITGQTFTASMGSANNTVSYSHRWLLSGVELGTGQTVVPTSVGNLVLEVTATNSLGVTTVVNSVAATIGIAGNFLKSLSVPAITGNTTPGSTLTVSTGGWSNSPTSYTYQWRKNGDVIPEQKAQTYLLKSSDLGAIINCSVTANKTGFSSSTALSNNTAQVADSTLYAIDFTTLTNGQKIADKYVLPSDGTSISLSSSKGGLANWIAAKNVSGNYVDATDLAIVNGGMQLTNSTIGNYVGLKTESNQFEITFYVNPGHRTAFTMASFGTYGYSSSAIFDLYDGLTFYNPLTGQTTRFGDGLFFGTRPNKISFAVDGVTNTIVVSVNNNYTGTVDTNGFWDLKFNNFGMYDYSGYQSTSQPIVSKVELKPLPVPASLNVIESSFANDASTGAQILTFKGTWTGTPPTTISVTAYDDSGLVAINKSITNTTVNSNGTFTATMTTPVPVELQGTYPVYRLEKTNVPLNYVDYSRARADYRPNLKMGTNINGVTYYSQGTPFKDWKHNMFFQITGGTYTNVNRYVNNEKIEGTWGGVGALIDLYKAGIIDADLNLKKWPDGATEVKLTFPWVPSDAEMGQRKLILPPNQRFTLSSGAGQYGITKVSGDEALATGVHIFNFVKVPGEFFNDTSIIIDKETFTPWTNFSLRKVNDTSNQIIVDEFVDGVKDFQILRFMDALGANSGGIWNIFEGRLNLGWTIEAITELCIRSGASPWIVPGHKTPPAVAAQYVNYLESHLPAGMTIYMDPFNEVWGGIQALLLQFWVYSYISGRSTNEGYGEPIPAEKIHEYQGDYDFCRRAVGLRKSILANEYVSGNTYGASKTGGLWKAKANLPEGTKLPAVPSDWDYLNCPPLEDNNWSFVSYPDPAKEYGARGRAITEAVKSVSSRIKVFINVQSGNGNSGLLQQALSYPITQGGIDSWGAIVDGACIAPYMRWSESQGYTYALNKTSGTERVQNIGDQAEAVLQNVPNAIQTTKLGLRNLFDDLGRSKNPSIVACYEQGYELIYPNGGSAPPQSFKTDMYNFLSSDRCKNQLKRLHATCFNNGASYVVTYQYGPGTEVAEHFPFGHATYYGDKSSAQISADISVAQICAPGIATFPNIVN